ncbi:MAG: helix-turn-helix domain-containing protein [Methanobacteriota archaeon]
MTLTEVVFEVDREDYELCRFTSDHPETRIVYRVVGSPDEGSLRGLYTAVAGGDIATGLVKRMQASDRYDEVEVASLTPYAVVVRTETGKAKARGEPATLLADAFGRDTIVEPFVFQKGRLRIKLVSPRRLETRDVVERLQSLKKEAGWSEFRVVRVGSFDPVELAYRLRRVLSLQQEELVRLAVLMGYYETPKRCNLEDIARRLGLSVSPVHKKLKEVEHLLIHAYLDPTSVPVQHSAPRRAPRTSRIPTAGAMREVTLLLKKQEYEAIAFTAKYKNTRVIFHPLHDTEEGAQTLFIVVARAPEYQEFLKDFAESPRVKKFEVLAEDPDHVSLLALTEFSPRSRALAEIHGGANPLAELFATFGRDTYLKPVVVEAGAAILKVVVTRRVSDEDLIQRFESLCRETKWDEYEVLGVRDVSLESTLVGSGKGEEITARQEEVLRIAHALGYYRTPRECTLEDISNTLGISTNAVHKNLTAAEQKILQNYLGTQ